MKKHSLMCVLFFVCYLRVCSLPRQSYASMTNTVVGLLPTGAAVIQLVQSGLQAHRAGRLPHLAELYVARGRPLTVTHLKKYIAECGRSFPSKFKKIDLHGLLRSIASGIGLDEVPSSEGGVIDEGYVSDVANES